VTGYFGSPDSAGDKNFGMPNGTSPNFYFYGDYHPTNSDSTITDSVKIDSFRVWVKCFNAQPRIRFSVYSYDLAGTKISDQLAISDTFAVNDTGVAIKKFTFIPATPIRIPSPGAGFTYSLIIDPASTSNLYILYSAEVKGFDRLTAAALPATWSTGFQLNLDPRIAAFYTTIVGGGPAPSTSARRRKILGGD
jgi:hypothetical protein